MSYEANPPKLPAGVVQTHGERAGLRKGEIKLLPSSREYAEADWKWLLKEFGDLDLEHFYINVRPALHNEWVHERRFPARDLKGAYKYAFDLLKKQEADSVHIDARLSIRFNSGFDNRDAYAFGVFERELVHYVTKLNRDGQRTSTDGPFPLDEAERRASQIAKFSGSNTIVTLGEDPKGQIVHRYEAHTGKLVALTPNAAQHYVWVISHRGDPIASEGPYGPYPLSNAKTTARIAATNGQHDRIVTRGIDPLARSFDVVAHYRHGTGEKV